MIPDKYIILYHDEEIPQYNDENQKFSEYIKMCRNRIGIPTKELAKIIDVNYEQLRKIINKQRKTSKRDCIIAISAALFLNGEETNTALNLYDMPLLTNDSSRDYEIIAILAEQIRDKKRKSLNEINDILVNAGFAPLDIINSKKHALSIKNLFEATKIETNISCAEMLLYDQYDSLSTQFSPDNYICNAEQILKDKNTGIKYKILYSTREEFFINDIDNNSFIKDYNSTSVSKEFEFYLNNLRRKANYKLDELFKILNDTKNYNTRVSANILDYSLHIFAETYNYYYPMIEEYYMFEYINDKIILSVFKNSEFMHYYLPNEEYEKIYGKNKNMLIDQYNSIEEITPNDVIRRNRTRIFKQLKEKADTLKQELIEKKKYIRNLNYIYEDKDRVCQYYDLEKEFQCETDDEYHDIMVATKESIDIKTSDNKSINITLNDLYQAFELGIDSVEDICRIKENYGSIKKILS